MKNWLKIGICLFILTGCLIGWSSADRETSKPGPEGTNSTYNLAFDVRSWTQRIRWVSPGVDTDSILVHASGSWVRRIAPISTHLAPYATTSSMNTALSGYASLSGSYSNPSFINSLAWAKISGAPIIPTNTNQLTNGSGFITSYTETDPLFNSKFSSKTTSDLIEGTNLYYTDSRFDTRFNSKSTTNLLEGTNLYYTLSRARASFAAGVGIDLSSGIITNTQPDPGRIINTATVGLSKATLNSSYPNVPVGYMVMCPNILLGGAVYIKATEAGTSDVWQTVSAPPTL